MTNWQLQAAKQRFSEVVRAAEGGEPQFITRHGHPVAVIIDVADYQRSRSARPSLSAFLLAAPTVGDDVAFPAREADPDRAAALADDVA
ncbi:MAG: prevent-host-death protein [Microbacterium sp.]|nr:MAG: prevent-host-death protein [Microbacterium sp.]